MTYPRIVRSCECHNGHVWQGAVVFGEGTRHMPGMEEDRRCPFCNSIATAESHWRIQMSQWNVFELDLAKRYGGYSLGANPTPFGGKPCLDKRPERWCYSRLVCHNGLEYSVDTLKKGTA